MINAKELPATLSDPELTKIMYDRNISGSMENIRRAVLEVISRYVESKAEEAIGSF